VPVRFYSTSERPFGYSSNFSRHGILMEVRETLRRRGAAGAEGGEGGRGG
jgi:hypothetical protein